MAASRRTMVLPCAQFDMAWPFPIALEQHRYVNDHPRRVVDDCMTINHATRVARRQPRKPALECDGERFNLLLRAGREGAAGRELLLQAWWQVAVPRRVV